MAVFLVDCSTKSIARDVNETQTAVKCHDLYVHVTP